MSVALILMCQSIIVYEAPKAVVKDMMARFSAKYPDKGYLIVVDEFLATYLLGMNGNRFGSGIFPCRWVRCAPRASLSYLWRTGKRFLTILGSVLYRII